MDTLTLTHRPEGWTVTALGPWAAAIVELFGVAQLRLVGMHAGASAQHVVACLADVLPADITIAVEE